MQNPAAEMAMVTKTTEGPIWPIAPTAKTAMKYTSASARNENRSMMLPSANVPSTPPTCNIDPITAASDTDAPRSLSTVGSQFERKLRLRVDQPEQVCDAFVRAPGEREEPHRFRQPQRQDRNQQQRRDAADDKYRAPAELRNQRRRGQAADGCAQREPAEHDHHHGGAAAMRTELGRHGNGIRHRAAETKAGQKSDREEGGDVLDER